MFKDILISLLFAFAINWAVSMQLLAQITKQKRVKVISITLALFLCSVSALLIRSF